MSDIHVALYHMVHTTKREKGPLCGKHTGGLVRTHTGGRSPEFPDCHAPPGKKVNTQGGVTVWELSLEK